MKRIDGRSLRHSAKYALAGGIMTGLLTLLCYRLGFDLSFAAPVYLLIIVLQSLTGDLLSAALISVLAVGCLDYYFVEPLLTFNVMRPSDALALGSFLITALVITQLVSRLRAEMQFTKAKKDRLDRLYQLSQQLLILEPDATEEMLLEPFHRLFGITAISVFDAQSGEMRLVGSAQSRLAERTRDAYSAGSDSHDIAAGISIRCLRLGSNLKEAIGFEGLKDAEETVGHLAALMSAHLQKTMALRSASTASAAAQAEVYRSAILDALAHEFKTPLATILTAVGGLREAGFLGPEQSEMADTVEEEAARLGRLSSRLLRLACLDREDVRPRIELMDIDAEVRNIADQYLRQWPDRQISVVNSGESTEEPADPELFRLALSQLLDNACKYSSPGAKIRIALEYGQDGFAVEVANTGSVIPSPEQRRIFERFYRGAETKGHTSGSGLGLYVARKIALAHGGSLYLMAEEGTSGGVTFRLEMPGASQSQSIHVVTSK